MAGKFPYSLKDALKRLFFKRRLTKIEPLIFSRSFDVYQRYSEVVKIIHSMNNKTNDLRLLEVGAGGLGIRGWLDIDEYPYVTLLDVSSERLKHKSSRVECERIVADGRYLPFRSNTFSIVLSLATLEHVDKKRRVMFTNEVKRVAKFMVVMYIPIAPVANIGDVKFAKTHVRLFGKEDEPTKQHIMYGQPTLAELTTYFPRCHLKFFQNLVVWYVTMVLARLRIISFLTGLFYIALLSKFDRRPPFYGCVLIWHKSAKDGRF